MNQLGYAWAYGDIVFPAWQRVVHGRPIAKHLALLQRTQWIGADVLTRLQGEDLRDLLVHAGSHVPYYRELFASARFDPRGVRSRDDLAALPVLTRQMVRARHDDLIDPATRGRNIEKQTSGTSGSPLRIEYSNESETWRQATRLRAYRWAGYRQGLPTLHYWGTGGRVARGLRALKTRVDRALRREVYVDCARQDDDSMRELVRLIARMQPKTIVAFTHALATFARWVVDHDARDWGDIAILGGAEAMAPADRSALLRAFGPNVFETYGGRETMLVAAECPAHDGLHVAEENLVVEILRADGTPAEPGETGAVVITDLHNAGMPLIRYANGDMATWSPPGRCACGRELRRIARVDGRESDTMRDARGAPVPGIVFHSLLNSHEAQIHEFQAVQKRSGDVELRIVPGRAWSEREFGETARRLASYFRGLPFRVTLVDAIPSDPSGKRRVVMVER
jgi:phenylacetate-CoA ligase